MSTEKKNDAKSEEVHPATFATFWKCALQVNPWTYGKQYQGADHNLTEDEYNKAIVDRCLKRDIRVVGIADHGSVEGVPKLRDALEAAALTVFPGFEIASTEKVHMVCLYPSGTDIATLNQHLGNLEIPKSSKTAPSSLGCLDIAKRVAKQGGFWYAAHVTGARTVQAQALTAVCFSLWRAAFLADRIGTRAATLRDARTFLGRMLMDNAITYPQDRASREWTFNYYANAARDGLLLLAKTWPNIGITLSAAKKVVKGSTAPSRRWDRHQSALDVALSEFEKTLEK